MTSLWRNKEALPEQSLVEIMQNNIDKAKIKRTEQSNQAVVQDIDNTMTPYSFRFLCGIPYLGICVSISPYILLYRGFCNVSLPND